MRCMGEKASKNGEELRAIRERLRLTQGQMGDALGVALNTIWRAENGRYDPSPLLMHAARLLARVRELEDRQ